MRISEREELFNLTLQPAKHSKMKLFLQKFVKENDQEENEEREEVKEDKKKKETTPGKTNPR